MSAKTPRIARQEVIASIKERIANVTDLAKLNYLHGLTPHYGSEIRKIVEARIEEITRQIAIKETAKCTTEEEAAALYKNSTWIYKGETAKIYLKCWIHFAEKEAPIKASACKTYEEALSLYQNAPDQSKAKSTYFRLLQKFETDSVRMWLDQCKTSEEIDSLIKRLVSGEAQKRCKDRKRGLYEIEMRAKLLLCTSADDVIKLLEEDTERNFDFIDIASFLLEKFAREKMQEETACCKSSIDAERLIRKYSRVPDISKVYRELYLEFLTKEAKAFVETLNSNDPFRELWLKHKTSPDGSEAKKIYLDEYHRLLDESDIELLPFGREIGIGEFAGWYTEVLSNDYSNARRLETIFMHQLLEQGHI